MKSPFCCGSHGNKRKNLRHLLLLFDMIGIDSFVAVEFIMMVGNIQTLGVPVIYSSIPGVISAVLCLFLMPVLGLLIEKYAKSKYSKAIVLVCVNFIQIIGGALVFVANLMQLFQHGDSADKNDMELLSNSSKMDSFVSVPTSTAAAAGVPPSSVSFPVPGIIAILGYGLVDAGYDVSNCFMKTFIMALTPTEDHSHLIVMSIFVGSFGGCFITLVGSLGIGKMLTDGTTYDANAAECAFLSGLCILNLFLCMIVTLLTGLFYIMEDNKQHDIRPNSIVSPEAIQKERTRLLMESTTSTDYFKESLEQAWTFSQSSTHTLLEHSGLITQRGKRASGTHDQTSLVPTVRVQRMTSKPQSKGICAFLSRNRARIFLCMATFLACGAHYAYNMFSVNFVGIAVYHGNPTAAVGSLEYVNYLAGTQAGSFGFIFLYVSFVFAALSQNFILQHCGWLMETVIVSILFVGTTLACAVSKATMMYYVTTSINGIFRALVFTVPYILVDRLVKDQQNKDQSSKATGSLDIVMIAAMWPCAFAVCSGVMGPLLDWTGNVATPIFYSAATSALGLIMFCFLRKY